MLKSHKLLLEQSEKRERTNELLGKSELSSEERAELGTLTTRLQEIETEYRAALTAEGVVETRTGDDGEAAELRALRQRVTVGNYATAALNGRGATGAELDLNQAYKIKENHFPLILLAPELEVRAETDIDTSVVPRGWLDRLFATSAASRVGVTFESVSPGVASFPVTTAGATGAQRARMENTAIATWEVLVKEGKPKANSVHLVFSKEDAFRVPNLEESLTRDLRMALMDAVDLAVFEGDSDADGTDANIVGLQTATGVVEKTLTQANKVKHVNTLKEFVELIDGKHAEMPGDLRIVSSVGANVLWTTTIANAAAENQTVAQFLMASGINWTVRGGIDTATGNNKFGAFIGRNRGLAGAGTAAVWSAGELVRDDYSGARKREVALSLNYYWGFCRGPGCKLRTTEICIIAGGRYGQ